jgi:hypothetical protein
MALPSNATKVHLDSSTDDPKQARGELASLVDKFNALLAALGNVAELDRGAGLIEVSGALKLEVSSTDVITIDCGSL